MRKKRPRFVGIDLGAESIKIVDAVPTPTGLRPVRRERVEHDKEPGRVLLDLLSRWDWDGVAGAAATGRFSSLVRLPRIPTKHAQASGFRCVRDEGPATIVSIGGHGFSVLELRSSGVEIYRQNSRCSQGTGNFLRQLVARFDLTVEEASLLCEDDNEGAHLSGRCPVILKTDMTHLANRGESRERILAGLYDAVCENVQSLIKPRVCPPRIMLVGGVTRSLRIRRNLDRFAAKHGMELLPASDEDIVFLDALGCACEAAACPVPALPLPELLTTARPEALDRVAPLHEHQSRVRRMRPAALAAASGPRRIALGFDIGSTGSKAVALDESTRDVVWQSYVSTGGDPVGAAQSLTRNFLGERRPGHEVVALGATGSGREIVGSLLASCFGVDSVYVLNEIAAHAEGALHYDPRVDTIFEIGGQDAKYIRLARGRVVDAAMNEACSAGTGSFIEEQGRKFSGIRDVVHLGEEALRADCGVSLGQHCSVFMAEIIDEAVAAGVETPAIVAGIYDSIVQNYLNRVKGSRSVGDVIFCQGMPFSADALAAAVAARTGSEVIIPPSPGAVGAVGIALLSMKAIPPEKRSPLDLHRLLAARVTRKDTFECKSTKGCGGSGNHCRIDRITTVIGDTGQKFTWGGGCSLWDRGIGKRKLPDRAPDPFRQRTELVQAVLNAAGSSGGPRVVLTDTFQLKGLFPFFATYLAELGLELVVETGADHAALKRGAEESNVAFCAPMQLCHGMVSRMAEREADFVFLPMLRHLPRVKDEPHAVLCPIVQAAPDLLRHDLPSAARARIVAPVIDFGPSGLDSTAFRRSCALMARDFGVTNGRGRAAYRVARAAQERFDAACTGIGADALAYCAAHGVVPVVVLGRPYTIHNNVLNSNVPALLREQGALAIPVDCYPVATDAPVFPALFWGYGQRSLRAAHQIRRAPGVYSLWCSNYACGPDSFNLHFYSYIMEGKPFAIIETDGHAGDAGTKTRVEAFLHCVQEDREARTTSNAREFARVGSDRVGLAKMRLSGTRVLIPRMGPGAETIAACLRGAGMQAEALPPTDRAALHAGRRHTSGKECLPMCLTLGSLLCRLESAEPDERFTLLMPKCCGPCRQGAYHLLHEIVLARLGLRDRVDIWSPDDADYFEGMPGGFAALIFTGIVAGDLLLEALYDVRPVETRPGAAEAIYAAAHRDVLAALEKAGSRNLTVPAALWEAWSGNLFGCTPVLRRAARSFAAIKAPSVRPTVLVNGEIYVRCDPGANNAIIDKLEQRGLRVRFAPAHEWFEYSDYSALVERFKSGFGARLSSHVQGRTLAHSHAVMAGPLGWPARSDVPSVVAAARPYLNEALLGEALLTVGGPLHEWRAGLIDGVLSVGPHECMPTKIAEAQLFHVAEAEGLPALTIPLNGDPIDPEVIDGFVFEVKQSSLRRGARPCFAIRRQDRDRARASLARKVDAAGLTEKPCKEA